MKREKANTCVYVHVHEHNNEDACTMNVVQYGLTSALWQHYM